MKCIWCEITKWFVIMKTEEKNAIFENNVYEFEILQRDKIIL